MEETIKVKFSGSVTCFTCGGSARGFLEQIEYTDIRELVEFYEKHSKKNHIVILDIQTRQDTRKR